VDVSPYNYRTGLNTAPVHAWFPGSHTIDPNDGFTADALGRAAADSWLHGHVPYWNSNEGLGAPLAGEMQSGAFSPLVLLRHWPSGALWLRIVLELVAGLSTVALLVRLGLTRAAATLGGVLFALNGTHAWLANAVFAPIAFLPVVVLGIEEAVARSRSGRGGGYGWIAVGMSLSIVAGFPEVAYLDGLLIGLWAVVRFFQLEPSSRRSLVVKVSGGLVMGVALAAPALAAFLDFLRVADVGGHSGAFSTRHLDRRFLSTMLLPYTAGPIFGGGTAASNHFWSDTGGYLGVSTVGLAVLGLVTPGWRALKFALGAFALLVTVRIFGMVWFMTPLWNLVPGVRTVAFYRYAWPSLEFAVAVLAALGADRIVRRQRGDRNAAVALSVFGVCFLALVWQARSNVQQIAAWWGRVPVAVLTVGGATLVVLVLVASTWWTERVRWMPWLLGAVVVAETVVLFAFPQMSASRSAARIDAAPVQFLQSHLGTDRFLTLGPISPNYGSAFGIAELNVNDLPIPKGWARFVRSELRSGARPENFVAVSTDEFLANTDAYANAGVRYVVVAAGDDATAVARDASLRHVLSSDTSDVFELPDPRPYFAAAGCTTHFVGRTQVTVSCDAPAVLHRLELSMPGWSATINGRSVPVVSTANGLQSVDLRAGSSVVRFQFEPPYISWAWTLTALACVIPIAMSRSSRQRRRRAAASE
jgi:hypothetical protein